MCVVVGDYLGPTFNIRKPATYFFWTRTSENVEKSTRNLESKKKLIPKCIFRRSEAQTKKPSIFFEK